jgi:hypothetical protein
MSEFPLSMVSTSMNSHDAVEIISSLIDKIYQLVLKTRADEI